ncbi:MAG: hypothetical protein L0I76_28900 [Pseudonocardia sp.]|nr:hypothetical protein [Pseudonocardia sp.]
MPAVYEAVGAGLGGASGTTAPVPVPAGVVAGKGVFVCLYLEANKTITPPAGDTWTLIGGAPVAGGSSIWSYVYWKRASGVDSGNYTFTWTGSTWRRGGAVRVGDMLATGDPVAAFDQAGDGASASTTPAVSVTTDEADQLLLLFPCCFNDAGWTSYTAGYTERLDNGEMAIATAVRATPGSTGSVTATSAGTGARTGTLVAVSEATSGGPVSLAGTSAATAGAAASLAAARPLAGSVGGAAAAVGSLARARPLGGAAAGTAAVVGAAAVARPLAGSVGGVSAASGALTVLGGGQLQGASGAASALSGALVVDRPLAGTVAGASALSAALFTDPPGSDDLAGESHGVSALSGALVVARALDGAVAAVSGHDAAPNIVGFPPPIADPLPPRSAGWRPRPTRVRTSAAAL